MLAYSSLKWSSSIGFCPTRCGAAGTGSDVETDGVVRSKVAFVGKCECKIAYGFLLFVIAGQYRKDCGGCMRGPLQALLSG